MWRRTWRFAGLAVLLLALPGHGQEPESEGIDPTLVPPDVFINVKEYPQGSEMVTVTMLKDNFPSEYLRDSCQMVGVENGRGIRGLAINDTGLGTETEFSVRRATFATDDLIDQSTGALALQPLIRAFSGIPDPWTVSSFVVTFEGESPQYRTLRKLENSAVVVVSKVMADPDAVEYRVVLKNQERESILIPDLVDEEPAPPVLESNKPGVNPLVYVLLGIGALAGGALVYFAALRPSSRR